MDDILKDDEVELDDELPADDELDIKKKGLLDDEAVESIDDLKEEEDPVDDEPFDDINPL